MSKQVTVIGSSQDGGSTFTQGQAVIVLSAGSTQQQAVAASLAAEVCSAAQAPTNGFKIGVVNYVGTDTPAPGSSINQANSYYQ